MQTQLSEAIITIQVIVLLGQLILFALMRIGAKRERENIAEQVRLYRETKTNERTIDSLIHCHRLLHEGLRVCVLVKHMPEPVPQRLYRQLFDDSLRISDSLTGSSWMCGDLGDRVRRFGLAFQYMPGSNESRKAAEALEQEIHEFSKDIEVRIGELLKQR